MTQKISDIIYKLQATHNADAAELLALLKCDDDDALETLQKAAQAQAVATFGHNVYLRGLIEFTNYCKNDCYYCGIRRSNDKASRYRLTPEEILRCCEAGYAAGLRTFVLQGGEDYTYDDNKLAGVVAAIKKSYPDCAVTLSAGERPHNIYQMWFDAGADRYLLRYETANAKHYGLLHPPALSLPHRLDCLRDLKSIGYQAGTGFMVGSPFQMLENIVEDLQFIKEFNPHMVGIGPFIPHKDTPFCSKPAGSAALTLRLLSILRLLLPKALLPATTALNTLSENGHQLGILAGGNVIMPNLSPAAVRSKYSLYNNKRSTGSEATEGIALLKNSLRQIGYTVPVSRGDYPGVNK